MGHCLPSKIISVTKFSLLRFHFGHSAYPGPFLAALTSDYPESEAQMSVNRGVAAGKALFNFFLATTSFPSHPSYSAPCRFIHFEKRFTTRKQSWKKYATLLPQKKPPIGVLRLWQWKSFRTLHFLVRIVFLGGNLAMAKAFAFS